MSECVCVLYVCGGRGVVVDVVIFMFETLFATLKVKCVLLCKCGCIECVCYGDGCLLLSECGCIECSGWCVLIGACLLLCECACIECGCWCVFDEA